LTVTSKDIPNISISGYPSDAEYSDTAFRPSQSTEEARRFIDEKNKGGFPFNAWVDVTAGAGIVPGGVVYIDEYNSNFDGIWYVKSVTHEVGGSMYITKLEIGRDFTLGTEYQVPLVEPFATPPAPRFLNNVWTSSLPRVNKYV
jgi:hypothetical protein